MESIVSSTVVKSPSSVRLAALAMLIGAGGAWATVYNDAAAGNWNAAATWTAGSGYPQAGDGVYLDTAGTVVATQNEQFGGVGVTSNWLNSGGHVQIDNGMTLTHLPGGTFNLYVENNQLLGGGTSGRFLNQGTVQQTYFYRDLELRNGITFENQGAYHFPTTWACLSIEAGSTFYSNDGTIEVNTVGGGIAGVAAGNAGTFTTWNGVSHQGLTINIASGASLMIGENYFVKTGLQGKVHLADLTVASTGILRISGGSSPDFSGDFTADGALHVRNDGIFNLGADVTLNFGQGMTWNRASIDLKGHTLTSISNITQAALDDGNISLNDSVGGGKFVNQGTFTHNQTWRGLDIQNNTVFENAGLFQSLIQDDAVINLVGAGSAFRNLADGVLEFKSGNATAGYNNVTGLGTLDNQGTYVVSNGTNSRVGGTTTITQYSGTTLTGGTWIATGVGSSLNLKFNGRVNLATIGTNATVILENGGTIDAINAALTTVDGTFIVNGTSTFVDASGFTVGSTGRVGGSGTIQATVTANGAVSPGNSAGTLTVGSLAASSTAVFEIELGGTAAGSQYDVLAVVGSLDLGGAWLDISFINGFETGILATDVFTIMTAGTLSGSFGNLVDGQVFLGDGPERFMVTIDYDNGLVRLGNYTIPEPASALLLAVGGLGLLRRRGRRG